MKKIREWIVEWTLDDWLFSGVLLVTVGFIIWIILAVIKEEPKPHRTETGINYAVVVIDGCQYLQFKTDFYDAITHKGNCTNAIHKTAKSTNTMVILETIKAHE